ncbi:hypothetical protein HL653_08805 [Sphingomonas sp. AP4-R1]|uniref:hypothetical protein n=1 Tax=Sphingomonas sp. AP4-R1 TaxID=2735134 RepID=UPI0014935335|nr:hypothetical protein [Sphingomonas sp. AP4-R1]QJU57879.1 hypothetical protein HL653_08805 [Sphingomonas sp. AP4-R1]
MIAAPIWGAGAAAPPPPADPEIIVNGKRIILEGGEWEFDRSVGIGATHVSRPMKWKACIPAGDQIVMLRQLLGAMPAVQVAAGSGTLCGKMSFRFRGNRVTGRQGCRVVVVGEQLTASYDRSQWLEAIVTEDRIAVESEIATDGGARGPSRTSWRMTARRVGICRMPQTFASKSAAPGMLTRAAEPAPAAIPPRLFLEPLDVSLSITRDMLASPLMEEGRDTLPAREDDIVVIGRRLRRAKLHFANEGRLLVWCHTDVSTGDARVDRIACAIVQACVREGVSELLPVRACYARKVALLDDDIRAARGRKPTS